ncbi:MAG: methyltransferase domain-containing protein [Lachnospiraceae bacterium]|nr:methyltransferase domain-containing protein [Lachnospiraceae bacterium]
MNIKWDANKYSSDFSFVHQYGNSVIDLIDDDNRGTVLDLGCGNGVLSKVMFDKGYHVIGIDASNELLEIAKKNYPDIHFIDADATNFSLEQPVDVVFSNAVFHWINSEHQQDMLKCVHEALKEKGQFVFEFGGYGNNQIIHRALEKTFSEQKYTYEMPFYFPTISEYAALLENAGFRVTYAILFDRPTELKGENGLKDWIKMFTKTPFSVVKDEDEKREIIDKTVENLRDILYKEGKWYADYVRIRMKAIRL